MKTELRKSLWLEDWYVIEPHHETGGFPDYVDSVSEDQAHLLWRVVEKLRTEEFPNELRM